jgi:hypothetical protein
MYRRFSALVRRNAIPLVEPVELRELLGKGIMMTR